MGIRSSWEWQNPEFLWLLLLIPVYLFFKYKSVWKGTSGLGLPSIKAFVKDSSFLTLFANVLPLLRAGIFALLILALARPIIPIASNDINNELGVDIMLCLDVSRSMLNRDFSPDRLSAVKKISTEFVAERTSDRIGAVSYSDEAILKMPLTKDKEMLQETIAKLDTEEMDPGTNIGLGLITAINHIKDSEAKSKVIILMSDGENKLNPKYDPLLAADIALSKEIKVYTIGVGKRGKILMTDGNQDPQGNFNFFQGISNLDEELLQNIASISEGKYYRATSEKELKSIYDEINSLEKSDINAKKILGYEELYKKYLVWALMLLGIEMILRTTIYKSA